MSTLTLYQIDAFSEELFCGNPAAVCFLDQWLPTQLMQNIAAENNLAETAFVVRQGDDFLIRWFTPKVEVELCGHATLASGYVLFKLLNWKENEVRFYTAWDRELKVFREEDLFFLDFPTDHLTQQEALSGKLEKCLATPVLEVWKGKTDLLALVSDEYALRHLRPDFDTIQHLDARGLIVTSPGDDVDFVSRFFAPQSGIKEDPVTGSAHTSLTPFWSERLNKIDMRAKQLSLRGGNLVCKYQQDRCFIGGSAVLYMVGEFNVPT